MDDMLTGCASIAGEMAMGITAWPDADLNGDVLSSESTSGEFIEIAGPDGRAMPIARVSQRQTSTVLRTQEAETVCVASFFKNEAIPSQNLMQQILGRPMPINIMEDVEGGMRTNDAPRCPDAENFSWFRQRLLHASK